MLYSRDYIAYISRELIAGLSKAVIKLGSPEIVNEKVREAITNELAAEDKLNEEVRTLLERYAGEMRETGASYGESFKRVKRQLMKERGVVPAAGREGADGPRMSRDKIIKLSHAILHALTHLRKEVELRAEPNDVRLEAVRLLIALSREEEKMDRAVREKIRSHKRPIPEGSQEWDILYRKYYSEEMKKRGVA
jgi:hypothetical protein